MTPVYRRKNKNADYHFYATVMFARKYLLKSDGG
jgi:hypothetical protein